jgi:DNA-binding PadR family transcriptional regulator
MQPDTIRLNSDEMRLLNDLKTRGGEARISANKSHSQLERLVELAFVSAQLAKGTTDTVLYSLTEEGRDWLRNNLPA